ncbi:winged helix-turn-helix transcriptional regulator, partial [Clostridioides difficile]|uniref:winged helix-turn-helix transcriptional regulator n=1 Tax=Clostridioides difficile TaxID=1496 RepID=UPI0014328E1E
ISHKILSQELKYLDREGLIKIMSYPTISQSVVYLSTKRGKSLESILLELCNRGKQYMMYLIHIFKKKSNMYLI